MSVKHGTREHTVRCISQLRTSCHHVLIHRHFTHYTNAVLLLVFRDKYVAELLCVWMVRCVATSMRPTSWQEASPIVAR